MLRFILAIILALPLTACLPQFEESHIIVDGKAKIKVAPDQFRIEASLVARGEDRKDVLKEIAALLTTINEETTLLSGLTHLKIEQSSVSFDPKYASDCLEVSEYSDERSCEVSGYFSAAQLKITGSPADQAGNMLSLLAELGAEYVDLRGYQISNYDEALDEAITAALKDARAKAEKLASASGSTISGLARVQYGQGFSDNWRPDRFAGGEVALDTVQLTGQRKTPLVVLQFTPQPIEVSAEVVAAFKID